LIAWLPFVAAWERAVRGLPAVHRGAVTDYWDGHLARQRNLVTDLGRLLDRSPDKLLLLATLVPMYLLQRHTQFLVPLGAPFPEPSPFLFETPFAHVSLPLWIVLVVLGARRS
jgi:hypothetical protein